MIKYYCDRCGIVTKECYQEKGNWLFLKPHSELKGEKVDNRKYYELGDFILCAECASKFKDFLNEGGQE